MFITKEVKDAKVRVKKVKKSLKKATRNYKASLKHGTEKQQALCKARMDKAEIRMAKAIEKLDAAKTESPSLLSRMKDKVHDNVTTGLKLTTLLFILSYIIYRIKSIAGDDSVEAPDTL